MLKNKKTVTLLFLFVYWLLLNYLVLHTPFDVFTSPEVKAINHARYLINEQYSPEDTYNEASTRHSQMQFNWQSVDLPDDWYKNKRKQQQLWYQTQVTVNEFSEKIWAVYIPSVTHNVAVYINGIWVGQSGKFSDPVSRNHNKPQLFSFSSGLLKQGENRIDIKVKAAYHEQGLLDQFYFAPASELRDAYEWKYLIRVDLVKWLTLAMYVLSLIILAFWLARSQDSVYGLFALELFIWATHNLNLFISDIPVSASIWEAMTMSTLGWTVAVMLLFNHRYVGYGNARVEKIVLIFSVLGIGIFFLPDIGSILHVGYSVWDLFVMIFGVYAIYHLLSVYRYQSNPDVFLMLLVGLPILVSGFHDILMINHFIDRRDGLIMQFSVIPSVILFSWFLVRRFVTSVAQAENLARTLEQRVEQKQLEIQSQYEKLKLMERESVLAEERERIMRDMHDGIGGQLVSVIALLQEQSGDVFKSVREKVQLSLIDLRFVIDSLDPVLGDLPTLLGMMRMRMEDQLNAANIELEWRVTDLPEIENMSPRNSLNIMRIVQEAMTNSIKHSGSVKLTLATGVVENKVFINVVDYGRSAVLKDNIHGRGIKNMQFRAQQLGADLNIRVLETGVTISLLLCIRKT